MKQMLFFSKSIWNHFARRVMMGVLDAPEFDREWQLRIHTPPRTDSEMRNLLAPIVPDAVVIFDLKTSFVAMLLKKKIPCVIIDSDSHPWANIPVVEIDHYAMGRLAADYFIDRKYKYFGVARTSDRALFLVRQSGFVERLEKLGLPYELFRIPGIEGTPQLFRTHKVYPSARNWLIKLPKPCAVFAANDPAGMKIIEACHELGIRVPEDVAVLGVDNNILVCRTTPTQLSSIHLPFEEQGLRAAQLLCNWDPANPPGRSFHRIRRLEIVSRASTTSVAAHDPIVVRALKYIENHIAEPFHISDLRKLTGISTPNLIARFKAELGLTPIEVVRRERIECAKKLLQETNKSVGMTAKASGFRSLEHFCKVFREMAGQSTAAISANCSGNLGRYGSFPFDRP